MQELEKQILTDLYKHYQEEHSRETSVYFHPSAHIKKADMIRSLNYLDECGYIEIFARAAGFFSFKLTINGIKFIENGFKETKSASIIQGNNNIYVSGSQNTVSGNYNQISIDISNSALSEDCKELIKSFLYEIKNPTLTPEKKSEKVKSFLTNISSGTISGMAATGLTTLLTSLFNQIPF